jgi:hypothetical protein
MSRDCGVLLGIERPDWAFVQPPSARASVYAATGDNVSVAAGRVSFVLGLHGPCSSVDTACSSALAAIHWTAKALTQGGCNDAVALAVSLKLVPNTALVMAEAGMLSIDGRCKTFDMRANGMARSEGVGALTLARRHAHGALQLQGSALRQDGRSASLTAPNGSAQRKLLLAALSRASLEPTDLRTVEAHGTGTALGDPTEVGALLRIYASVDVGLALVVGAAKASLGHSEAASGQIGLLRIHQTIRRLGTSRNAHLRVLNALLLQPVRAHCGRFLLPFQGMMSSSACAVSAFGYSGTIAHAAVTSRGMCFDSLTMRPSLAYRRCSFLCKDVASCPAVTSGAIAKDTHELHLMRAGSISSLVVRMQHVPSRPRMAGVLELHVQAAALNFRDVLNMLHLDPTQTVRPLGVLPPMPSAHATATHPESSSNRCSTHACHAHSMATSNTL